MAFLIRLFAVYSFAISVLHCRLIHRYFSTSLGRNALAKARPFESGSPLFGVVVFWPVSLGSWPGGAWVPWRAVPWSCGVFVVSGDPGS